MPATMSGSCKEESLGGEDGVDLARGSNSRPASSLC